MVKHIVFFKLKDKADTAKAIEVLNGMKGKIDGLISLEAGVDFLNSPRSCDIALTCTLRDRTALEFYQEHPAHEPAKILMKEICSNIACVDYEV